MLVVSTKFRLKRINQAAGGLRIEKLATRSIAGKHATRVLDLQRSRDLIGTRTRNNRKQAQKVRRRKAKFKAGSRRLSAREHKIISESSLQQLDMSALWNVHNMYIR